MAMVQSNGEDCTVPREDLPGYTHTDDSQFDTFESTPKSECHTTSLSPCMCFDNQITTDNVEKTDANSSPNLQI